MSRRNVHSMTLGDARSSNYETSTGTAFQNLINSGPEIDPREALEIDKDYVTAMHKVGLEGVNLISKEVLRCVEQKASTASKAKVYLNKAFQTFDAGGGMISAKNFRSALGNFGLQFTEDQVLALFGCYDGSRQGFVHYPTWVEKAIKEDNLKLKKFQAMASWGERERKWEQLEKKFDNQSRNPPPRRQEAPRQAHGGRRASQQQNQWGGGNNSDEHKVRRLYERFCNHPQLDQGFLPGSQEVAAWLQDEGLPSAHSLARRVVVRLDPCETNGEVQSFEEFWDWWRSQGSCGGEAPQIDRRDPPPQIDQYRALPHRDVQLERAQYGGLARPCTSPVRPGSASARNFLEGLRSKRGTSGYVPYHQRVQQQQNYQPLQQQQQQPQPQQQPQQQQQQQSSRVYPRNSTQGNWSQKEPYSLAPSGLPPRPQRSHFNQGSGFQTGYRL